MLSNQTQQTDKHWQHLNSNYTTTPQPTTGYLKLRKQLYESISRLFLHSQIVFTFCEYSNTAEHTYLLLLEGFWLRHHLTQKSVRALNTAFWHTAEYVGVKVFMTVLTELLCLCPPPGCSPLRSPVLTTARISTNITPSQEPDTHRRSEPEPVSVWQHSGDHQWNYLTDDRKI